MMLMLEPSWPLAEPQLCPLAGRMAFYRIPGVSVAVLSDGRLMRAEAHGEKVSPETLFQAGGLGMAVTAAVALRLVARGELALDAEIRTEWAAGITVRQLLSHTAGLAAVEFPGVPVNEPLPGVRDLLAGAVRQQTPPGSGFVYTEAGYLLLQWLLESATGMTLADLAHRLVFQPLGMAHSTYDPTPFRSVATGHRIGGAPIPGGSHRFAETGVKGLWSTPSDLARLGWALLTGAGGFLPDELLGIGLVVEGTGPGTRRLKHMGSLNRPQQGFAAALVADEATRTVAAVMANAEDGWTMAPEIIRSIGVGLGWRADLPESLWPLRLPRRQETFEVLPEGAAGTYGLPDGQALQIYADGGGLWLKAGEQPAVALLPMGDGVFVARGLDLLCRFVGDACLLAAGGAAMEARR